MKLLALIAFVVVVCSCVSQIVGLKAFQKPTNADQDEILNGISVIRVAGSPGFLSVYGDNAFPIIAGRQGNANPTRHPMAAGGKFGTGRMIGFGHDNFLTPEDPEEFPDDPSDTNQFILNAFKWLAGGKALTSAAVVPLSDAKENDTIIKFLQSNNVSVTTILLEDLPNFSSLEGFDFVCVRAFIDTDSVPVLKQYLENGGGVGIALTSWAYYYFNKVYGEFGSNWAPNMLSKPFGFVWRNDEGDSIGGSTLPGSLFNASQSYLVDTTFPESWSQVKAAVMNPVGGSEIFQYSSVFEAGAQAIPKDAPFFSDPTVYADALNLTQVEGQPIPSIQQPVNETIDKFKLQVFQGLSAAVLKPEDIVAHPASPIFPGNLSSSGQRVTSHKFTLEPRKSMLAGTKSFKRSFVTRYESQCTGEGLGMPHATEAHNRPFAEEEEEDNSFPVWYSTGLYAEAGSIVIVQIESDLGPNMPFLTLQIGTHTDDISNMAGWYRPPRVVRRTYFTNGTAVLSSPYGGSIFIVSADGLGTVDQPIEFTFSGVEKAPYFKLGETTIKQWREVSRLEPGPWTELVTDKIVISAPSSYIRDLDDPESLLIFWDEVMDAIADLAAIPHDRHHPERLVPDVQISAGFMHSGYPIMTFLPEGRIPLNLTMLRNEGSWGHFHELGHNHQQDAWTFDGTGEVGCNIFALYVYNSVCGIPREQTRFEMTPASYQPDIRAYIESNLDFNVWKSKPFMALMFFVQLQETYGWSAYRKVFAAYHELADEDYPATNQDKMDLWLVMFSKAVEENLFDFFVSWGIPLSSGISDQLTQYPTANISITDLL